ncbi:MAG: TlpA family protein disulfide reductase [Campylobacteraceae bacterium]
MFKKIIFVFILSLGCLFAQSNGVKVGEKAPSISAKDVSGQKIDLNDYKGKVVVVKFWEKGCASCMAELPQLQLLKDANKDKLAIITINSYNSFEDIKKIQNDFNIDYIFAKDDIDITAKRYGVIIVPTMFLIDENGLVKDKIFGMQSWEKNKNKILKLL